MTLTPESSGPILIVEDEAIVAADLEERLQQMGYATLGPASSGEEALAIAREQKPRLVLTDIRIRGKIDGIDVAEIVRAELDIPVIFLTSHADPATLRRAQITESFGYLLKPFDERMLEITIGMALYKHGAEAERKRLALELDKAQKEVETLTGLLTTCAFCKNIEDDTGKWVPIEQYVAKRSEAKFSHTFCPDCIRKQYPDIADKILNGSDEDES